MPLYLIFRFIAFRILRIMTSKEKQRMKLAKTYDPKEIEERLYKKWEDNGYFHAEVDRSKKPFTIVTPPPHITGKLHM